MTMVSFEIVSDNDRVTCTYNIVSGELSILGLSADDALKLARNVTARADAGKKVAPVGVKPGVDKALKVAPAKAPLNNITQVVTAQDDPDRVIAATVDAMNQAVIESDHKANGNGVAKLHAVPSVPEVVVPVKAKPSVKQDVFVEDEDFQKLSDKAKEEPMPPELAKAKVMREVLNYFVSQGVTNHNELVEVCHAWKDRLSPLSKLDGDVFAARIKTAAVTLRIGTAE